jgi:hypothetical protein
MQCSNPIQCQLAERTECVCSCGGANHGKLRARLIDSNPEVATQAQKDLIELRAQQKVSKKAKSTERRKRRALALKEITNASN